MEDVSHMGVIATNNILDPAIINYNEADAYNIAIQNLQNTELDPFRAAFEQNMWDADMNMHTTVDTFINASTAVMEVVRVNELAAAAVAADDLPTAQNVKDYAVANDVILDTAEVDAYNQGLSDVTLATQSYAALQAVYSSPDAMSALQADADASGITADFAQSTVAFNQSTGDVEFTITDGTNSALLTYSATAFYSADNADILTQGETNPYYTNGITQAQSACLLNTAASVGACSGRSGFGPPPNTLLWTAPMDQGGVPMGYTDANGDIINYAAGDTVIDPNGGTEVGFFDNNMVFNCTNANYCSVTV